jgi:hypothetical protein
MASFAYAEHPSQHFISMARAQLAAQSVQRISFTIEPLAQFAKRIAALAGPAIERWAAARHRAAEDRVYWQLALTDPRLMAELRAIQDHAESDGA